MDFYRTHQSDIRKDYLSGVYDVISRGDREGNAIGSRIILPISFTRGPFYMYSHYLDALVICRALGNSQFFITFTCNVNWLEIKRHMNLYHELLLGDRADVVVRVFQQKVQEFCKYLKDSRLFGTVIGRCQSFEDIRTVNSRLYSTFRAACEALGLLGDDKEWDTALMEACFSSTPSELRNLTSESLRISQLHINDPELEQYALFELEIILKTSSKSVEDFGLPSLFKDLLDELRNKELMEEKSYNREELAEENKYSYTAMEELERPLVCNGYSLRDKIKPKQTKPSTGMKRA
ncbi:DNA helicase [Tanacetum coccineum]